MRNSSETALKERQCIQKTMCHVHIQSLHHFLFWNLQAVTRLLKSDTFHLFS